MVSLRGGWVGGKGSGKPLKRTEWGQGKLSGDGLLCAEAGNSCKPGRGYSLRRGNWLAGFRPPDNSCWGQKPKGGEEERLASKNCRT